MYGRKVAAAFAIASVAAAAQFSGTSALEFTRQAVALGPRPPGSPALQNLAASIRAHIKKLGAEDLSYSFTAKTPNGAITMMNVIARFAASGAPSRTAVVVSGHYDTELMPKFVGANDGGSSTGFLMELARALARSTLRKDVYLVWFDGEEALREWSDEDSLHGSRDLAARWQRDGTLKRIEALINVDMIGDRDLGILEETASSPALRNLIRASAESLGHGRYFQAGAMSVGDDHMPFVQRGVNAVDVIDLNYDSWHTPADTMDKLSARSLQIVGDVVVDVLRRLGVTLQ